MEPESSKSYDEKSYGSRTKYDDVKLPPIPPPAPFSLSGPPVLDKFGNFRRAPIEDVPLSSTLPDKPPEPPSYRRGRSKSRSRSRSLDSRSHRRSRSRSYGARNSRSPSGT